MSPLFLHYSFDNEFSFPRIMSANVFPFQMTSFAAPYGDCEDTMPVSNCKLQCKTELVVEQCGCVSGYMRQFNPEKGNCELYRFND